MNAALANVLTAVERLDAEQQEELAARIQGYIEEIQEEKGWEALVLSPKSRAYLARMSERIDQQIAAGEVHDLDDVE